MGSIIDISGGVNPELDHSPSIATSGRNVVAVWYDKGRENLRGSVSRDGGVTWSASIIGPGRLSRPSTCIDSRQSAFCAVDGVDVGGYTILIFKASFQDPVWQWQRQQNAVPPISFGADVPEGVRILSDHTNDVLYLVYTLRPERYQGRIQFVRSTNGGASWSPPVELSGSQCNTAQFALGPNGELYVVWEDYAQGAIVGRKSTDQGVSFNVPFTLGAIRDNVSFGPPGWQDGSRSAMLDNVECMDFPAFLGVAVDTGAGPRRGAIYGVWSEYALGTVDPDPIRTVVETEPNGDFASATPIQIGDDVSGGMVGTDTSGDCDVFTFGATAGTTIQITGGATYCHPVGGCTNPSFGISLLCGDDPSNLTQVGCGSLYNRTSIPPVVYTLPATGRYYLDLCGGVGTFVYELQFREYVITPGQGALDHRDVVLVRSTDGGATWSDKVRVNDDAPSYDNAMPAVAVDASGRVYVAWYDRREDPECGAQVHTRWTYSEDGGATFASSLRASEQPSGGGRHYDGRGLQNTWQVGDHLALRAEGERAYLLWTHIPIGAACPQLPCDGDIFGSVIGFETDRPEILDVEPDVGAPGIGVEIRGRNLSDATAVLFRDQSVSFTVVSDSLITTEVPVDGRTGYVTVVNPPLAGVSAGLFYVTPRIGSVLPSRGLVGQAVKLVGANFTGASQVRFNGVPSSFTVVSDTLITTMVPGGANEGPIEVVAPGGTVASDPFLIGHLNSGINLAWDDCGANGVTLKRFACDTNLGPMFTLVGSFTPPVGVDRFTGITADLRVINPSGQPLPDWWRVSTGGCRPDALGTSYDFTAGPTTCRDFYQGPLSNSISYEPAYGGPAHARLLMSATIPTEGVGPLDAGTEYYAFKVHVARVQSIGKESCAGCSSTMRLELRSIQLHQPVESGFAPVLTTPLIRQVAYWQNSGPDIVSFLPRQAPAGAQVGLRGLGFTGATMVTLSGINAPFTVVSDSLILASLPTGATSGPITVINPYGSDTSDEPLTIGPRLGSINLSWSDCGTYGDALHRFACDSNAGTPFDLVASFRPPPEVARATGLTAVLTIANPNGVLPDWWKHGAGGCRVAFASSFDFTSGPFSCVDLFQGIAVGGGLGYLAGGSDPSRARVVVQAGIPEELAGSLDPNVEYYAAIVRVRRSNTVGTEACAGCETPVCIGLESVTISQPPEFGYDPMIDMPADNTAVAWQNLDPACLAIVPVHVVVVVAEADVDRIRIVWELPGAEGATLYRREIDGEWRRLERLVPDGAHRIEYVDHDVRAGVTYGYRLQLDGEEVFVGETSLAVPNRAWTLALGGLSWSSGSVRGTITLPAAGPAALEIFDLVGRRRATERLDGLDAGEHRVDVRTALRPGVYFGRLTQGRAAVTRRFVVVE